MTIPVYVSEVAPVNIRGQMLTGFQLMITFGLMASNIISGGFSYIEPVKIGWRLMFLFAALPAAVQFVGFLFLPESPRWLHEHGYQQKTKKVLNNIYNQDGDWIAYELNEIQESYKAELKAKQFLNGQTALSRIFDTPHVRRALLVGCLLQAFQQLAGINTIIYYTSSIIRSAGIMNSHNTIWISVIISGVNFASTLVPIWLIERIGRRLLLLISVAGVTLSLLAMGTAFLLINRVSGDVLELPSNFNATKLSLSCSKYRNCDFCATDEQCGFCTILDGDKKGYCLPNDPNNSSRSLIGPCSVNNNPQRYFYSSTYCSTKYTALPIIVMVFYLSFFAIGFAPLPWVLNAEFYPLWARSICCSITTCVNWIFNLIISLTFLTLTEAVTKYGTFFIYAAITCCSFVYFLFSVPETKGYTIEGVEVLFMDKKEKHDALVKMQIKESRNSKDNSVV
uniref:MFS domain-containing protein n=1 Tax=Syphacia muris TaxID=451379 RepID=A0A0N5ACA5_9BILA